MISRHSHKLPKRFWSFSPFVQCVYHYSGSNICNCFFSDSEEQITRRCSTHVNEDQNKCEEIHKRNEQWIQSVKWEWSKEPKEVVEEGHTKKRNTTTKKWYENEHKNEYIKKNCLKRDTDVWCVMHTCISQLGIGRHSFERFWMNSEQQHLNIKYKHIFNNNHVMNT